MEWDNVRIQPHEQYNIEKARGGSSMFNTFEHSLIMTHSSASGMFLTILIVFGSVLLTLTYVAWKRYNHVTEESNFVDKNEPED